MIHRAGRLSGIGPVALLVVTSVAAAGTPEGVEIVASRAGFRPPAVKARKGDNLRLVLTTADGEHCFALDAYRVEKRILPGKSTTVELTLDRPGSFPFYCCLEPDNQALRGKLIVTE